LKSLRPARAPGPAPPHSRSRARPPRTRVRCPYCHSSGYCSPARPARTAATAQAGPDDATLPAPTRRSRRFRPPHRMQSYEPRYQPWNRRRDRYRFSVVCGLCSSPGSWSTA
jgi:hypothetical protein